LRRQVVISHLQHYDYNREYKRSYFNTDINTKGMKASELKGAILVQSDQDMRHISEVK